MKLVSKIKKRFLNSAFQGNRLSLMIFRFISKTLWHLNFNKIIEYRIAKKYLGVNKKGDRILDLGCGNGVFTSKLRGEVVGLDISFESIKRAKRISKGDFVVANAEFLPFKDSCLDKVVSLCVFEHLKDDRKVLNEIRRVLKPGGLLVLTVDSFTLENDYQIIEKHRKDHAVYRYYTYQELKEKLEKEGFKILEHKYFVSSKFLKPIIRFGIKNKFGLSYKFLLPFAIFLSIFDRSHDSGYFLAVKAIKT